MIINKTGSIGTTRPHLQSVRKVKVWLQTHVHMHTQYTHMHIKIYKWNFVYKDTKEEG